MTNDADTTWRQKTNSKSQTFIREEQEQYKMLALRRLYKRQEIQV